MAIASHQEFAIAVPLSQIRLSPGSSMQVQGLTWSDYQQLLTELGDHRTMRIAYSAGVIEIYMPSQFHEIVNRLLAKIIFALAEELGQDINDLGSTTLNRQDLDRGIEPDSCFYIQQASQVQGLNPQLAAIPPDLAVEVDIFSSSACKMPIYQAMGVPEVWIYETEQVKILQLQNSQYQEVKYSPTFPSISGKQLAEWLKLRETGSDLTVIRAVRQFCKIGESGSH